MKVAVPFAMGFSLGRGMGNVENLPVAKGAAILAVGVGIGYSVAMHNQEPNGQVKEATADFIKTMRAIGVDAWLDIKTEMAAAKAAEAENDKNKDAIDGTAEEVVVSLEEQGETQ